MSKAHAYRLLQAAHVVSQLAGQSPMGDSLQVTPHHVPDSEAIARELVPLLRNPQAFDEAWNEAVEQANGMPTAEDKHGHLQELIQMVRGIPRPLPYDKQKREEVLEEEA